MTEKPTARIIISLYGNRPNLEIEGELTLGGLIQLLRTAENIIMSQPIKTKDIEDVKVEVEPEGKKPKEK
jgi:hypothetical protein